MRLKHSCLGLFSDATPLLKTMEPFRNIAESLRETIPGFLPEGFPLHDFRGLPLDCMVGYRHAFGYIFVGTLRCRIGSGFPLFRHLTERCHDTVSGRTPQSPATTDCRQLLPPCRVVDCRYHSPTLPLATFLTVKEASRITGKSPSSIRRIIYPIIHDDKHPDRTHIQPTVEEAMQLRMKGENFAWRVSEELLRREMPVEATTEKTTKLSGHAEQDLLAMLQGELQIKNQQIVQQGELISKQMELISGLSERLREGNVLIGSLQQHLALPEGRGGIQTIKSKTKRAPSTGAGEGEYDFAQTRQAEEEFPFPDFRIGRAMTSTELLPVGTEAVPLKRYRLPASSERGLPSSLSWRRHSGRSKAASFRRTSLKRPTGS